MCILPVSAVSKLQSEYEARVAQLNARAEVLRIENDKLLTEVAKREFSYAVSLFFPPPPLWFAYMAPVFSVKFNISYASLLVSSVIIRRV